MRFFKKYPYTVLDTLVGAYKALGLGASNVPGVFVFAGLLRKLKIWGFYMCSKVNPF